MAAALGLVRGYLGRIHFSLGRNNPIPGSPAISCCWDLAQLICLKRQGCPLSGLSPDLKLPLDSHHAPIGQPGSNSHCPSKRRQKADVGRHRC